MPICRAPIPYLLAINPRFPASGIPPAFDFVFPVEVSAGYVETVDVAGDDARDEEEGVDEAVHSWSCDEEDGDGWAWGGVSGVDEGRDRGRRAVNLKGKLGESGTRTEDVDCED